MPKRIQHNQIEWNWRRLKYESGIWGDISAIGLGVVFVMIALIGSSIRLTYRIDENHKRITELEGRMYNAEEDIIERMK